MAKEKQGTTLVEKCMADVELIRVSGSFEKDGEEIEYVKYTVSVDGAELEISFDKSVKNLIDRFIPFVAVKDEA